MAESHQPLHAPGFLSVLSRPSHALGLDQYHEWYNTEHGPLRMRLGFLRIGQRYRSRHLDPPLWLATYDVVNLACFEGSMYMRLRANRSPRETLLLQKGLDMMDRRIYKTLSSRGHVKDAAPVIMIASVVAKNENVAEIHAWYQDEHLDHISRIPGWRRSRRFQLIESTDQRADSEELLAVHDFDAINGLGGPEHERAKSAPWRNRILQILERHDSRIFDFAHSFDPGDYREPTDADLKKLEQRVGVLQQQPTSTTPKGCT